MQFDSKPYYIAKLLGSEGYKYLIPAYQRSYSWEKEQCETLWDDVLRVYKDNKENNKNEEYFLGSIVTYKSDKKTLDRSKTLEVIDGQQRLTTFTLLFRAFYESLKTEEEEEQAAYLRDFGKCIWDYDREKQKFIFEACHLKSEVITDGDLDILKAIFCEKIDLKKLENSKSLYATNYLFFYKKLMKFKGNKSFSLSKFCDFFLDENLFVLLIICDSKDSALTIFNTLNSRGKPLANADLIKGAIYDVIENKDKFVEDWKKLESKIEGNEKHNLDFSFMQLMHIVKAKNNDTSNLLKSIVNFFTKDENGREYLNVDKYEVMEFLSNLTDFWINPQKYLNDKAMMYIQILDRFPNASWKPPVSCLVWKNKQCFKEENFDEEKFSKDFEKYLPTLVKLVAIRFLDNKTETKIILDRVIKLNASILSSYKYDNNKEDDFSMPADVFYDRTGRMDARKLKFILLLYAYVLDDFKTLIDVSKDKLEVEHILPKKWQSANFDGWDSETHKEFVEQIGNKMLLEGKANRQCTNNFFAKKQEEYQKSQFKEARELGKRPEQRWLKEDIEKRNKQIYEKIKNFLSS